MTLNYQRFNSVECARIFLYNLMDPKKTPRVPKKIRDEARVILKHFPSKGDMEIVSKAIPSLFNQS
jgi:hypothetical protein